MGICINLTRCMYVYLWMCMQHTCISSWFHTYAFYQFNQYVCISCSRDIYTFNIENDIIQNDKCVYVILVSIYICISCWIQYICIFVVKWCIRDFSIRWNMWNLRYKYTWNPTDYIKKRICCPRTSAFLMKHVGFEVQMYLKSHKLH